MREVDAVVLEQAPAELSTSTPVRSVLGIQEVDNPATVAVSSHARAIATAPEANGIIGGNGNLVLVLLWCGARWHVGKDPGMEIDPIEEPALLYLSLKRTIPIPRQSFSGKLGYCR